MSEGAGSKSRRTVRGILFDKDGTLFDFSTTWDNWAAEVISELSRGESGRARSIAQAIDFDMSSRRLRANSPIVAGTNRLAAELIAAALPGSAVPDVEDYLTSKAVDAVLSPIVALRPLLDRIIESDISIGVVTNDSERSARSHLGSAGVLHLFDFVAGFDTGHGAKPSPEPLLSFASQVGLPVDEVVMVGDSTHDLHAGRAAGMICVAVLSGPAGEEELAPYADAVLPDIGHLPEWLGLTTP